MIASMKKLFGTDGMRREAGARVESSGVITTPGVAYLARSLPADAGVVVSASHNPFQDNGIKIFAPTGRKLDDATERLIEADIYAEIAGGADNEGGAAPEVAAAPKGVGEGAAGAGGGAPQEGGQHPAEP